VRVLIGTPAIGVKLMLVSTIAVMHRRQTRPIAQVSEDTRPCATTVQPDGPVLLSGTRMTARETVPAHPAPRNDEDWQHLRHAWKVMVKSRVETCHLGQIWKSAVKRFSQQDLFRHMVRIKWTEELQLRNHFRSNSLRLVILRPTMHDAMPDRDQCVAPAALLDPIIRTPTAAA